RMMRSASARSQLRRAVRRGSGGRSACQEKKRRDLLEREIFVESKREAVAAGHPMRGPEMSDSPWGTIKGQIIYDGDPIPERKPLNVSKDQEHCLGKGPILSEDWVVDKQNKGVRWTFVWLAPEPGGAALPIHPTLKGIPNKEV